MSKNNSKKAVAVVTGAGSGVGRAVAIGLMESGYHVALAGRRVAPLEQTQQSVPNAPSSLCHATDVSDPDAVSQLFDAVVEKFGRVDLLFNNAGTGAPPIPMDELSVDQWRAVVDVNLSGAFYCAQAAMRCMKQQQPKGGRIINNGSISAHVPRPFSAPYTATKHGITGLTRSISLDGRAHDIACGQIDIGNAQTPMTERMAEGVPQADGSVAVEPRIDARHVADALVYMASLPLDANVQFMNVMATKMPFIGRG